MIAFIIIICLASAYYLPWLRAFNRNHPQMALIFVLNTLFGWTGLGWVVCLVMAGA